MNKEKLQMKCPACGHYLSEKVIDDLVVNICDGGCGGIWFDDSELEDVDDQDEVAGEILVDIKQDLSISVDHSCKRSCPCCDGIIMQKRQYGPRQPVDIDECPGCGGIWLDAGELQAIRKVFESSDKRAKVNDAMSIVMANRVNIVTADERRKTHAFHAVAKFLGHMWHDYDLSHFRGREWPPWRGTFRD